MNIAKKKAQAVIEGFEDVLNTVFETAEGGRDVARSGVSAAVDRRLKKNTEAMSKARNYDPDAFEIAKVLARHYGDEAEAVLRRTIEFLSHPAVRAKR